MTSMVPILWRGAALLAAASLGFFLACLIMAPKPALSVDASRPAKSMGSIRVEQTAQSAEEFDFAAESLSGGNVMSLPGAASSGPEGRPLQKTSEMVSSAAEPVSTRNGGRQSFSTATRQMDFAAGTESIRRGAMDTAPGRRAGMNPVRHAQAGGFVAKASPAAPANPAAEADPIVAPEGNVALPVAFETTAEDTELTPTQRKKLDDIQKQFVSDIGGDSRDPNSPDDLPRWRRAQWTSDQQYRAMFGQQAFLQHQLATAWRNGRAGE